MKFSQYTLLTFLVSLAPMLCYADNDVELKRQVGTIPGLIILGVLALIQLTAFISSFVYFYNGHLKSLIMALIPTIITLIITIALLFLQLLRPPGDISFHLGLLLVLSINLALISLGRRKHALVVEHPDRFSLPPPLEKILGQRSRPFKER